MFIKKVAKLVLLDADDNYLLLYRNRHPLFGNDPDLPGGTLDPGESVLETMKREVREEIGVDIDGRMVTQIHSGTLPSLGGTYQTLFMVKLDHRPKIILSWEHASYEWLTRDDFLDKARHAKDLYMHTAYKAVKALSLSSHLY